MLSEEQIKALNYEYFHNDCTRGIRAVEQAVLSHLTSQAPEEARLTDEEKRSAAGDYPQATTGNQQACARIDQIIDNITKAQLAKASKVWFGDK